MPTRTAYYRWSAASVLLLLTIVKRSLSSVAPWQEFSGIKEEKWLADLPPSIFAPHGRLVSVERILQAAQDEHTSHTLVVAIPYQDGIVVLANLPPSPYLHDDDSSETSLLIEDGESGNNNLPPVPFVQLSRGCWAVVVGNAVDAQILVRQMQLQAEHLLPSGHDQLVRRLARRLADTCQIKTQSMSGEGRSSNTRLLAATAVLLTRNEIWKVDANGQFWKCHAIVAGCNEKRAQATLMEHIRPATTKNEMPEQDIEATLIGWSKEEALRVAYDCMQQAMATKLISTPRSELTRKGTKARRKRIRGLILSNADAEWLLTNELEAFSNDDVKRRN